MAGRNRRKGGVGWVMSEKRWKYRKRERKEGDQKKSTTLNQIKRVGKEQKKMLEHFEG